MQGIASSELPGLQRLSPHTCARAHTPYHHHHLSPVLSSPCSELPGSSLPLSLICSLKGLGLKTGRASLRSTAFEVVETSSSWLQASFLSPRPGSRPARTGSSLPWSQNRKGKQLPGSLLSPCVAQASDTVVGPEDGAQQSHAQGPNALPETNKVARRQKNIVPRCV